jgi:hypothetical protein
MAEQWTELVEARRQSHAARARARALCGAAMVLSNWCAEARERSEADRREAVDARSRWSDEIARVQATSHV